MESKDAEKMRLELEAFINRRLQINERVWPIKPPDMVEKSVSLPQDNEGYVTKIT